MFDYYDDEDFCPQPDPPHIKQLIRDIDSILNDKSISTNEWTCTIDESIVHIRINDDIYTLNQNMKFETPHGLVLYILKQKLEINTDDVY